MMVHGKKTLRSLETSCPECPAIKLLLELLKAIREPLETAMKELDDGIPHNMNG